LTTITGRTVLGQSGRVEVGAGQVSVLEDGTVLVDGNPVDRLHIVEFRAAPDLQRSGSTELMAPEGGPPPEAATGTTVRQGFVESSNVDVTATLTTIIEIQRAYEANQRMIQSQDELIGRAANDIARPTG
jgi:flagellar basal-body rod protein FlgG